VTVNGNDILNAHGTAVAGIAGAETNNDLGVAGAEWNSSNSKDQKHIQSHYWCGENESDPDLDVYGISAYYKWSWTTDISGTAGYESGDDMEFEGTSAAPPQIAALAALLISEDPLRTVSDVDTIIKQSTKGSNYAKLSFTVDEEQKAIPAVVDDKKAMDRE